MGKIRVLVVDDAVVFRRLVADELASDPALEVVGTAANGRIALAKLSQVNPDVVILDIEMPEMDGLKMLAELRKTHRQLPVIMFSSATERGAAVTLDALALGATDYFTKPGSTLGEPGGLAASLEVIRTQLIPQIKTLCAAAQIVAAKPKTWPTLPKIPAGQPSPAISVPRSGEGRLTGVIEAVAIGTSTGGPKALMEVFAQLPADFPVPILVVQHMPPMFTRMLAERLSAVSPLRVKEAFSGAAPEAGQAWIAPGDFHMIVVRDGAHARLLVHRDAPENSCRPAVDVLLQSMAKTYGPNSLSVILTGMGADGLRGCEAIRAAGGQIVVQDEATSVVWGMPGNIAKANLADKVLSLPLIAGEIVRRAVAHK